MLKRNSDKKLLFSIIKKGKKSAFGKEHRFDEIKTVEDFQRLVPISTYADYEDYIPRIVDNEEKNVLTTTPVIGFAQSSGSSGKVKVVLLTQSQVDMYKDYTFTRVLALADTYYKTHTGKGLKPGRGLLPYPSMAEVFPNGKPCSGIPDISAKQPGFLYPYILTIPFTSLFSPMAIDFKYMHLRFALEDRNVLYIFTVFFKACTELIRYMETNWQILVDDIEDGTVS